MRIVNIVQITDKYTEDIHAYCTLIDIINVHTQQSIKDQTPERYETRN